MWFQRGLWTNKKAGTARQWRKHDRREQKHVKLQHPLIPKGQAGDRESVCAAWFLTESCLVQKQAAPCELDQTKLETGLS